MSTDNTTREAIPSANIKGWLVVSMVGIVLVVVGLVWDVAQHAADPTLAAREGPLTLSNPSHALAALGLAGVVIGLAGTAWSVWRPVLQSTWAKLGAAVAGLAVLFVIAGGAWALTSGAGEGHDHTAAAADEHTHDDMSTEHTHDNMGEMDDEMAAHSHPTMDAYSERYAAATEEERRAADALLASGQESLARYANVEAALDAGYVAPKDPLGVMWHYSLPGGARDDHVLDPEVPEGLVYYTPEDGSTPMLAGAFFVLLPGADVPMPAGDLVVWHSHNCDSYWVTPEQPCEDSRRMLHIWTFDETTLVSPRTDREVTVEVVDPFGAPFTASIAVAP